MDPPFVTPYPTSLNGNTISWIDFQGGRAKLVLLKLPSSLRPGLLGTSGDQLVSFDLGLPARFMYKIDFSQDLLVIISCTTFVTYLCSLCDYSNQTSRNISTVRFKMVSDYFNHPLAKSESLILPSYNHRSILTLEIYDNKLAIFSRSELAAVGETWDNSCGESLLLNERMVI
jgi:hypothetical protein